MKKVVYYTALVALFIVCMLGVTLVMTLIEEWFDVKLGQLLMNFGFLVGVGLFFSLKPLIQMWLKDKPEKRHKDTVR